MIEARQSLVPVLQTGMETGKGAAAEDLGPLPATAKALLIALVCAWVLIALYAAADWLKRRGRRK